MNVLHLDQLKPVSEFLKCSICESTEAQSVSGYLPLAGVVGQVFTLLLKRHFPRVHDDWQIACLDICWVHLQDNIITITDGWSAAYKNTETASPRRLRSTSSRRIADSNTLVQRWSADMVCSYVVLKASHRWCKCILLLKSLADIVGRFK